MTTITGTRGNAVSSSVEGPTPGQPRTAASVNTPPLQTLLNNDLAIQDGYATRRPFSLTSATTTADIVEQYVMGETSLGATWPTANLTLQFSPSTISHTWKKVHLDRIDQGSVITFQTGTPYVTFLVWTAPANMTDVWLTFNRTNTNTWKLVSTQVGRDSVYEVDVLAAGTFAINDEPREVHIYNSAFGILPGGTINIDLEGTYFRGNTITIYARGLGASTSIAIRNSTSTTLHTLTMARDGNDAVCRMRYHDTLGWRAIDTHAGSRGQNQNLFLDHAAVNGTIDPAIPYHTITGLVSGTITMTVSDGTFVGQRVWLSVDQQSSGASVRVLFKGYGSASSFYLTGDLRVSSAVSPYGYGFSACELLWNGSRWFVVNRTI